MHEIDSAEEVLQKEYYGARTMKTQICGKRQRQKELVLQKKAIAEGVRVAEAQLWKL